MKQQLSLSSLAAIIRESVEAIFGEQLFWVLAETADVKKYAQKKWCFLKLIEKDGRDIVCDLSANIWPHGYNSILQFEKLTGTEFKSGLQIACQVKIVYHERFGLRLEIQQIDAAYTHGLQALEKQQTIARLLHELPHAAKMADGEIISLNQQLKLPKVVQRIALIAAANSDGYRDFTNEINGNPYGFKFYINHFAVQVQGVQAARQIAACLQQLYATSSDYDAVAIVRGGGSDTDLSAFDDYEVAKLIATFPIPVFTGIGHDRNVSIADMVGWQQKTPTKAAAILVDRAIGFAKDLLDADARVIHAAEQRSRLLAEKIFGLRQRIQWSVPRKLERQKMNIQSALQAITIKSNYLVRQNNRELQACFERIGKHAERLLQSRSFELTQKAALIMQASPERILERGFAMVLQEKKIVTGIEQLKSEKEMVVTMKNGSVNTRINSIES